MSTISASTTSTTAYKVTADTTGTLVLQTGASPTTAVTIDASQNVGIGTSSPTQKLHVYAASGSIRSYTETGNTSSAAFTAKNSGESVDYGVDSTGGYIQVVGAKPLLFYTNATERMRIDSSGQVGIAQTPAANGGPLQVTYNSSVNACVRLTTNNSSTAGELINFIKSTGTATGAITFGASQNTIVYGGTSDYRLKENIAPMTGALSVVSQLKPCTYTWKSDGSDGQGFIAHELAEVLPDAVVGEKDAIDADGNPKYQNIDTSFLVATLTAAIQELKAELDAAKADIATLKGAA